MKITLLPLGSYWGCLFVKNYKSKPSSDRRFFSWFPNIKNDNNTNLTALKCGRLGVPCCCPKQPHTPLSLVSIRFLQKLTQVRKKRGVFKFSQGAIMPHIDILLSYHEHFSTDFNASSDPSLKLATSRGLRIFILGMLHI